MLFNSFPFIVFFFVVFVAYYLLPHKYRWVLLLVSSYYFYYCFGINYLFFIAASTLISYFCAISIHKTENEKKKKGYLRLNILFNLGILFFFKYYNFSAHSLNYLFDKMGAGELPYSNFILTIGISFYTFSVMGYVLDVYYEKREPENHLGIYALYISFFPKLAAGPIDRSTNLLPQLHNKITFNYQYASLGMKMIVWGFFKKIVIADNLGIIVDQVYATPENYKGMALLIAVVLYAFQIYCDFSAYSDIAIGLSKILGFDLVENFNRPYLSKSITEFWRRWHMSLLRWFNDYLYTPIVMGLKKWKKVGIIIAVFVTFIASGLWHEAAFTFIVWGTLQAIALTYELLTKKARTKIGKKLPIWLVTVLSIFFTFTFTCFSDIFSRSKTIAGAFTILKNLFISSDLTWSQSMITGVSNIILIRVLLLLAFFLLLSPMVDKIIKGKPFNRSKSIEYLLFSCLVVSIVLFGNFGIAKFIYFQF